MRTVNVDVAQHGQRSMPLIFWIAGKSTPALTSLAMAVCRIVCGVTLSGSRPARTTARLKSASHVGAVAVRRLTGDHSRENQPF
jgi:hypothetical protein